MAKRKYYSIILIILLISVMALAQEGTTSSDSDKVNKSGDTMTGTLVLPAMQSSGTLLFTNISFNFQQLKARYWAFGHPTDMWVSDTTNFSFFTDINLNGNEIIGCANCGTADNEKMNKSGDNMTGTLWNNDTVGYWFRSGAGYNQTIIGYPASIFCCGITRITRSVSTGNNTGLVSIGQYYYNSTTILSNNDGGSISFLFHEPNPNLPANFNAGKFGISWENKTANTTSIDFNPRTGVSDTANNIPAVRFLGSGGMIILTGTLNISTLSGSGYRYLCIDDSEKVIQSSVACDLI